MRFKKLRNELKVLKHQSEEFYGLHNIFLMSSNIANYFASLFKVLVLNDLIQAVGNNLKDQNQMQQLLLKLLFNHMIFAKIIIKTAKKFI